jgi:hypothetical protein
MGVEFDALFRNFPELGKRKNLETAAVGENRTVPAHEVVKSAEVPDEFVTRPNMQVISIGKDNLTAEARKVFRRKRPFDCCLRCDIHKDRRLDFSVGRLQYAPAGLPFCFQQLEVCHSVV